jgi:hypothetical protein
MDNKIPSALLAFTLVTTLFLTGCQSPIPSSLPDGQVVQAVDGILKAFYTGDFAGAVRDMSAEMKKVFDETKFTNMADYIKQTYGNYHSCNGALIDLSNNQGYAVYRLPCSFDLGIVTVSVAYKTGSAQVEGLYLDSKTMRTPAP